ncbi:tRNA pseudouridine(55) synthase TruB [Nocardioides sp. AX2bis]|uniref:tRNA pseudouridine(55) synthase TruB n=1 Tax=Nocardioides sp. AX2bis TaxID=2653157 RepID=UPI0012EF3ED0|nr:tRNA pseudouridine(55) synthase TruB [Nocardioides sp. AX2bis]VXB75045.1 tRNA pseudouridine synthase B [Nocardioides sp. AX2bis]
MSTPRPEPVPGLVVVDKPGGMTSHDVVSRVRRLAGTRKVGHAGTLDPMATGVLVLGVGRATRLLGHLVLTEKTYEATIRLGGGTTTDDAEGEPLPPADPEAVAAAVAALDPERVRAVLATQVGERDQVPSTVSAIKVDGRRAYARVRDGEEVVLEPRRVTIHAIEVHDVAAVTTPEGGRVDVVVTVRCSSGTYVRAIARDLGDDLGVGGHLTALRRTRVGPFGLSEARTIEELSETYDVLAPGDAARLAFPVLELGEDAERDVRVGRPLDLELAGLTALLDGAGGLLALYEPREGRARPVAVLV